jgi:hypothetical protein
MPGRKKGVTVAAGPKRPEKVDQLPRSLYVYSELLFLIETFQVAT